MDLNKYKERINKRVEELERASKPKKMRVNEENQLILPFEEIK